MNRIILCLCVILAQTLNAHEDESNRQKPDGTEKSPPATIAAGRSATPAYVSIRDSFTFAINNIVLPIDDRGLIAALGARFGGGFRGLFHGQQFLFAGGFLMSGKIGDSIWTNGITPASGIHLYRAGRTLSTPSDTVGVYVLDRYDPPFAPSWQQWRTAVQLGADFYDGNNDSVYTPADLNANGRWDPDEDAPDLLGDVTAWCAIADTSGRFRFTDYQAKGIDIHQTMFGYRDAGIAGNILYLRYRITNRGTVAPVFDSVYFSLWADGDLGDYDDDMVGCDTLRQSAYTWNEGSDLQYGVNPPAFFITMLQGPASFIPGVTFVDLNQNGEFDPGEPALDTARVVRGPLLGRLNVPGARNLRHSSFTHTGRGIFYRSDPSNPLEARHLLLGKQTNGQDLDPCNDLLSQVFGLPCTQVDKRYWYSGDPAVAPGYGWIQTRGLDMRQMQNIGPFKLQTDKPVEVFCAYLLGRGTNERNSVEVARLVSDLAKSVYEHNFPVITDVPGEESHPTSFALYQNFPNPFNPTTTIQFSVGTYGHTSLRVYDVLGREVATLVNEVKVPGTYEVEWNAGNVASGVYFYRMQAGDFSQTKKLILLR